MRRIGITGAVLLTLAAAATAAAAGSGWKVQRSPNPRGATSSTLNAASCASRSACTAVGRYAKNSSTYLTLAESWNGKKWSIKPTSNPGPAFDDLLGVSCAGPKACMAVGNYQTTAPGVVLAERWNGKKWSVLHPIIPAGAAASGFYGVSCTSARSCTAVGYVDEASTYLTLVETWNGTRWSVKNTPNRPHAANNELYAVTCASRSACMAVGMSTHSNVSSALAERFNGRKWSIVYTPKPAGATFAELKGVSCTAPNTCTAAGDYEKAANQQRTLAERWNGKKWAIQKTPNPTTDPNKLLTSVSCTSAKACTAAGYTQGDLVWDQTIVEHWNGHKWSVQRSPSPGTDSELNGVSCSSATDCIAAGWYEKNHTAPEKTLIEHG